MPGALFFGYIVGDLLKVPVSLIVLPLSFVFLWLSRRSSAVSPVRVLKEAPWSIVFFSIGMYIVVCGLEKCRFDDPLGALIARLEKGGVTLATVGMGFLAALLFSVMNNVPPVMVEAPAIEASGATGLFKAALIFANVIGSDLGPKLTPIGSPATLLWLPVLAKNKGVIGWWTKMKTGFALTIPALLVTLLALALWLSLIGKGWRLG